MNARAEEALGCEAIAEEKQDCAASAVQSCAEAEKMALSPSDKETVERLLSLQTDISREKNEGYLGKTVRVLIDAPAKNGKENMYSGRTDGGKLVHVEATPKDVGCFVTVKIEQIASFAMQGVILR